MIEFIFMLTRHDTTLSSAWHVPGVFELSVYRRPPLAGTGD